MATRKMTPDEEKFAAWLKEELKGKPTIIMNSGDTADQIITRNRTDANGKPRSEAELAKIREWAEKVEKKQVR
jgi:hypothetical protein